MRQQLLLIAAGYALFVIGAWAFERLRIRDAGPDALSAFVTLFLLQCALPGTVIFGLLPLADQAAPTTNPVLDRILLSLNPSTALAVLTLTVWFLIFFYAGAALGRLILPRIREGTELLTIEIALGRVFAVLVAGFAVTIYSFSLLGDSMLSRYTNLILFRAGYEGIERNALNANAFALTQTWSWLAVVTLIAIREQRGRRVLWLSCFLMAVLLAVLGVSRRSLFLPLLLAYLAAVLYHRKWFWQYVLVAALPLLLILAFGKDALAAFAWSGNVERVASTYESAVSAILRATSEMGLTIIESIGTLLWIDVPPRLGIDHVLSIARRFPEGMLGLNFQFPERIVRISTEAFAGANDQDIPPGLAGQMWLDFRILGPVVWGTLLGLQLSVVQHVFERTRMTHQAAGVLALLVFILALPITTGSFDFTFSIDVIVLVLALMLSVKVRQQTSWRMESAAPVLS